MAARENQKKLKKIFLHGRNYIYILNNFLRRQYEYHRKEFQNVSRRGGLDYPLNDAIFLRTTVLYSIGLTYLYENDIKNDLDSWDVNLSHGLDIRIGVGFRF